MKTAIVGYTGFVGTNLCLSFGFDAKYNSKNVEQAFGTKPDLLIYSGVKAEMFLANKYPEEDLKCIENAIYNIRMIQPHNVVLISTISTYEPELPYGKNRLYLENWVTDNYPDSLIVRLPALFGKGIKKNFIYDMIHVVPSLLVPKKYEELLKGTEWENEYQLQDNGFYKCVATSASTLSALKDYFRQKGFTALNFTDSRSLYQFFNLKHLWDIIVQALKHKLHMITITSEPLSAAEIFQYVYGIPFCNEIKDNYPIQNYLEPNADLLGGSNGYLFTKEEILRDIKSFIETESKE